MQTPTLTEARRALLELDSLTDNILNYGVKASMEKIKQRSAVIASYLDAQVSLNVENMTREDRRNFLRITQGTYGKLAPPYNGNLLNQPGVNDILTQGFDVDLDVVVVPVSLKQAKTWGTIVSFATEAERDAFALAMHDRANKDLNAFTKQTVAGVQVPMPTYGDVEIVKERIVQDRNANVPRVPGPFEGPIGVFPND